MRALAVAVACLALLAPAASAQRREGTPLISSDPGYFAPPDEPSAIAWSARDEGWFLRNRRIAGAGKALTVLGLVTAFALGVPRDSNLVIAAGLATQFTGQLTWSIADLRAANALRRRGHGVAKLPGIVAVCGAVLFSPVTWIAGPIQSAHLRRFHAGTHRGITTGYSLGAQLRF